VETSKRRIPTQVVNLVAQRSSEFLSSPELAVQDYERFVRSVEETYGVSIAVQQTLGPDNRPAAIDGVISPDGSAPGWQWTFRSDHNETRCALRFAAV